MPEKPEDYKLLYNNYMKHYRENHKEEIRTSQNKWRQTNKNNIDYILKNRENAKKYYDNNKDKILTPIICECGGKYKKMSYNTHLKTKKHCNFFNKNNETIEEK